MNSRLLNILLLMNYFEGPAASLKELLHRHLAAEFVYWTNVDRLVFRRRVMITCSTAKNTKQTRARYTLSV